MPHKVVIKIVTVAFARTELLVDELTKLGYDVQNPAVVGDDAGASELPESYFLYFAVTREHSAGAALVKQIRRLSRNAGIIAMTGSMHASGWSCLLNAGADCCLPLQCDSTILAASINALLRRLLNDWAPDREDVHLNPEDCLLRLNANVFRLRRTEFRICEHLVINRGRWISERELLHAVLNMRHDRPTSLVRVHVRRIREALADLSICIQSERGRGYRFVWPVDVSAHRRERETGTADLERGVASGSS